jgi:hypothetical protein
MRRLNDFPPRNPLEQRRHIQQQVIRRRLFRTVIDNDQPNNMSRIRKHI